MRPHALGASLLPLASMMALHCVAPARPAARLEGLASKLGERLVLSDDLQHVVGRPVRPLGGFELKGVPGTHTACAPAD